MNEKDSTRKKKNTSANNNKRTPLWENIITILIGLVFITAISIFSVNSRIAKEKEVETKDIHEKLDDDSHTYTEGGLRLMKTHFYNKFDLDYALEMLGTELPKLQLEDINGDKVTINSFKEKNTIISIMSLGEESSQNNYLALQEALSNTSENIEVITLYPLDSKEDVKTFYKNNTESKYSFSLLESDFDVKEEFGITHVPTMLFVDTSGRISYISIGEKESRVIEDMIQYAFVDKTKLYE